MSLIKFGYEIIPDVLDHAACCRMQEEIQAVFDADAKNEIEGKRGVRVGGRNLQQLWDGWRLITQQPAVADFVDEHVGHQAGLVRILYFDKPPGAGWSLALHRDQTIAVKAHVQPPAPFRNPTRKAGVNHVVATHELLSQMLTLRLHLDPMHSQNGPLIVVPGSHRFAEAEPVAPSSDSLMGRSSSSLESPGSLTGGAHNSIEIHCDAGDLFAMRPLLSHGSIACSSDTLDHRRVVHLEIAPTNQLPGSYQWYQFDSLSAKHES